VPLSPASREALLNLAREVIRQRVTGKDPDIPSAPAPTAAELVQPAGSFVTLHELETHRLRGCVGRLDATAPLWESVTQTAQSVLRDPRFLDHPVTADDLPKLSLDISVISPLRPTTAEGFDLLNEGIYVHFHERAGCFLPQVAQETGWSREQLLARLCMEKLNLPGEIWKHPEAKFFAFPVEQIGPEPFEV
jgi:AmmeMemoRadiSam system protein A